MPSNAKITEYISATSALLKKAEDRAAAAEAGLAKTTKQASDLNQLAELVADAVISAGQYKSAQRAQVIDGVKDHTKALKLIAKLASTIKSGQAPAAIGQPVASSKTTEVSLSPYVGQPTTKKKASDEAFEKYFSR
jgi:hypothetical protein